MTFNVCIEPIKPSLPGWVNLSIYDDYKSYRKTVIENSTGFDRIYVDANHTNCSTYTYTVPNDSFYYASAGARGDNYQAKVFFFSVDIKIKYINLTGLLNGSISYRSGVCNRTGISNSKPCSVAISDDWFSSAKNYDIFVSVTSQLDDPYYNLGLVKWQLSFQRLVYAVPAIAGAIVIIPIFLVTVGVSCCVYRKKGRKGGYEELPTITRMD